MKILRLSFQNINSLAHPEGKTDESWEIDFTRFNGLFAITGPTGSGKTTILDAIVLALYGKTPRVDEQTNRSYAFVSLGAKRASSEVLFEANDTTYLAQWEYRTISKTGRPLAAPEITHKIYEVEGNTKRELGELGKKGAKTIDRYISLSYEDFGKAVLLAQGAFSEFLFSSGKERALILQRITSTEVYNQIGQMAYGMRSQKEQEIRQLRERHALLHILTEEELAEVRNNLEQLQIKIVQLEEDQQQTQNWIALSRQRDYEINQRQSALQELKKNNEKLESAASSKQTAERYRRAEPLQPQLVRKQTLEKERTQLRLELENNRLSIFNLETDSNNTQEELKNAQASLEQFRAEVQVQEPILVQKEKQAVEFRRLNNELKEASQEKDTLSAKAQQTQLEKSRLESELATVADELKALETWQQQHQADATLETHLSGWQQLFSRVQELRIQIKKLDDEQKTRELQLAELTRQQQELQPKLGEIQEKVKSWESEVRETEKKLDQFIKTNGKIENINQVRIPQLNDQITRYKQAARDAQSLRSQVEEQQKKQQAILESAAKVQQLKESTLMLNEAFARTREELESTEAHIRKLELQLSVPLLRAELVAGQPCAVCGSTHHPDAHKTWTDEALQTAQKHRDLLGTRLKEQEQELKKAEKSLTQAETQRDNLIKETENAGTRLQNETQTFEEQFPELASFRHTPDSITQAASQLETELRKWQTLQTEWNNEQQRLQAAHQAYHKTKAEFETANKEQTELEKQILELQTAIQSEEKNKEQYLQEGRELSTRLCNEIQPYFTENIDKNNLKQSLELLANRSAHWKKNRQDSEEKKSQKARLEPELARLTANAESENERLNSLVNTCQTLQAKLEPLRDLELETFNYEQEKDKLTQTIKQAEEKVNALREKLQQQTVELTKLRSNEQNWSSQLERQTHELETIQQHLVEGITLAGFSNEIDLQEALSPEPETVRRIETEIRELEDKKLILESQIQGQTQTIDNFEAKLPSEATTENLLAEGNKLKEQHAEALEKKSLCQHTLEQQEENIASAKQYTEQLDALQKKIKTWEKLTKMLGGKEGRLFNEFAQSLTLRLLLRKANKLLKDLTDRYVLISEKDAEGQQNTPEGYLDIWVRDHYKGASERPVKNLSGGETFLVSLALSLALSEFASRNVELKSLFIDEGFGTLDPDALKQAIESLQKLSLKDKSVGIISHVDALKESIPCQIQVEKNGITGTSTLRMVY